MKKTKYFLAELCPDLHMILTKPSTHLQYLFFSCGQQKVTCGNKDRFTGVFPACCLKCP